MHCAHVICPQILRWLAVKQPHERQCLRPSCNIPQGTQHCCPRNEVECPYSIYGNQGAQGIHFRQSLQSVGNAFCSCSCGHRILERCRCRFHGFHELLGTIVRETSLRRMSTATMPRTPPRGFCNAVNLQLDSANYQEEPDSANFVMGRDAAEFVKKIKDQVRNRQKRMSNVADSGKEHSVIW